MAGVHDQLKRAVDAVIARRDALEDRDEAYRAMSEAGWSALRIEKEMRTALLKKGVSESEMVRLGISHDAVRRALHPELP